MVILIPLNIFTSNIIIAVISSLYCSAEIYTLTMIGVYLRILLGFKVFEHFFWTLVHFGTTVTPFSMYLIIMVQLAFLFTLIPLMTIIMIL